MKFFVIFLCVIASIELVEWLVRNILALKYWRSQQHLRPDSPSDLGGVNPPKVSIIVAAKDEQDNIENCLRSLLAQDYPGLEIICVNDRSTDATAEIVGRMMQEDSRLKLINIEKLPEGWCGKNHAMQHGIRESSGQWICMTDADCIMTGKSTISIAMRYSLDEKADMVSIVPTLKMHSFWETLLQPICGGVLMVWFPPAKVNDPAKSHAYANGMFMFINRTAYEKIGTHEAIAGSLIEDIDMARRVKNAGMNLRMIPSEGLISVRMYTSLSQIVRGWVRIFIGSFPRFWRQLRALMVLMGKGLTLYVAAVLGWIMLVAGAEHGCWWKACAVIGTVGSVIETVMTCRFFNQVCGKWPLGLLYPLGCLMTAGILCKAIFKHLTGGTIVWRNTSYKAGPQ